MKNLSKIAALILVSVFTTSILFGCTLTTEESLDPDGTIIEEGEILDTFRLTNHEIKVSDVKKSKNKNGDVVITINYIWTNNSDKTTNWFSNIKSKVSQDNKEIDRVITSDNEDKTMINIKSGDTLKNIEESFVAKSNSSIDLELFVEGDVAWITLDFPTE